MSDFPFNKTDTSQQAAATTCRSKAAILRDQIYDAIVASGKRGFTDEELQKQFRVPGNTQRPRRWELSHLRKIIKDSGLRRETDAGKNAVVWVEGIPAVAPKKEVNQVFDRISVIVVIINSQGGDTSALYINDHMVESGDRYDNDICARIKGWLACFTFMGWSGNYQSMRLTGDDQEAYKFLYNLPDNFKELPLDRMIIKKEIWQDI